MIVSKCPVRISFAGGSTDLDSFIQKHGRGAVISFSANLYTYISVFRDTFGQNFLDEKYNIVYSKKESTKNIEDIQNELVRVVLKKFSCKPLSCWFTADVSSAGSGLASSSSYILSFIHAINRLEGLGFSKDQIIKIAWELEKEFNPLTGFQDPFGCAVGGLNLHEKEKDGDVISESLDTALFDEISMFLLPTFINRSSTEVLEKVKDNVDPRMLYMVDDMFSAISNRDLGSFLDLIHEGWRLKKSASPMILGNKKLKDLDGLIESNADILAHRLIGAGNGGYFLLITKSGISKTEIESYFSKMILPVSIDYNGLSECKN
tara:strand:- start:194 stop:1153 length:960 start_codon:yes stop_codon:yes gene_type:complete